MMRVLTFFVTLLLSAFYINAQAAEYPLPAKNSRLIGKNFIYTVPDDGRSLEKIAAEFQIGLLGMMEANPDVDPYLPKPGSKLIIPAQMLLPDAPRQGIVINLAELRLFYYPPNKKSVIVYPIGIGQLGRNTPIMVTSVSQRIPNPTWTPTPNIRKLYAAEGIKLPVTVPAGPDNPMGAYALRLAAGKGHYLLHGTNADFGIGLRVSSGCIRLRPADIEALFKATPVGMRVQVINEPIKYSVEPDGRRYVEVHQPLSVNEKENPQTKPININKQLKAFIKRQDVNEKSVAAAIKRRSGMPVGVDNKGPSDITTPEELPVNAEAESVVQTDEEEVTVKILKALQE